MFMKTVLADGQAEQQVIREMKARAAGARGDIEQIVRGVMADVQQRGWDAVVEYAERFDGKAPYIVEPKVLDDAYNACDPKLIAALEKAAANIRDYHEQMLVKTWEWNRSKGETLGQTVRGLSRVGLSRSKTALFWVSVSVGLKESAYMFRVARRRIRQAC